MGRTRIVKMRFDLSNPYDVATYQKLAESARRGGRIGRGSQASYLASVMLGIRRYDHQWTGLTEIPCFTSPLQSLMDLRRMIETLTSESLKDIEERIQAFKAGQCFEGDEDTVQWAKEDQKRRPVLLLVPSGQQDTDTTGSISA